MREVLQNALGLLSKARYQAGEVHCAEEQTIIHLHALLGNRSVGLTNKTTLDELVFCILILSPVHCTES